VFPPELLPVETRRAIIAGIRKHSVRINHRTTALRNSEEDEDF